ncbi:MAG: FG-GAP repeat protein [Flavobacteriales bacterium]|nr:MAG: FG-GAP repeat protein [Flavobacteriales bacterium]
MKHQYTTIFLAALLGLATPGLSQGKKGSAVVRDTAASKQKPDLEELDFKPSEAEKILVAANCHRGYKCWISGTGFSLVPTQDIQGSFAFDIQGVGRGGYPIRKWVPLRSEVAGAVARYHAAEATAEYVHDQVGLRQNFIVHQAPVGDGMLRVDQRISSRDAGAVLVSEGDLRFVTAAGTVAASYNDLHVWDANGKELHAWFELEDDLLSIVVDDGGARYPVTIDPISTTPNRLLVGPQANQEFGISVATAGDLNGDGYSDVVVGAHLSSFGQATEGAAYVYYGTVNGIGAAASLILESNQAGAQFGCSVSTAGDVNGDGYSDLIVGARTWESAVGENNEGGAFVYYGSAIGIPSTPNVILQTNQTSDNFGSNVACGGDINDDGYSDVLVGAYLAAYGSTQEGVVFVYLGGAAGINPVPVHRLERNQSFWHFGRSIACAGDVNGDGYSDVIIGAPDSPNVNSDAGQAFVYFGGFNALGATLNVAPDQTLVGSTLLDGSFGWSVTCAGDVNADGYSDVAVGAYYDNQGGQAQEGTVWVFHGSAAGLSTTAAVVLQNNITTGWLGRAVSTAGDMNGDGYGDLLVGAPLSEAGEADEGLVYLYFGSATGLPSTASMNFQLNNAGANLGESVSTAGDVNGDGYTDMIIGARIYGTSGAAAIFHGGPYAMNLTNSGVRAGGATNAELGWSVAQAGDVNGDGYSDVLVGAPQAENGEVGEGLVYVHMGSSTGLSMVPALVLEANVANAQFGFSVSTAGDVNGDGYADVVIGAPLSNNIGRAYVFLGSPAGLNTVPTRTYTGAAASRLGYSVGTAGDINADGFSEILIGAPDIIQAYLYHGSAAGPSLVADVTLTQGVVGGLFGHWVTTAGDVNGDGYSDVAISARAFTNVQTNEGAVFIYHGSVTGLQLPAATQIEPNQASANFGVGLSAAGDVNGDGYFDIVVGADAWESGQTDEGAAFVYYGSPTGINTATPTIFQRNVVNARVGKAVSEGGDINGDGYADIVVGAPVLENGPQTDEGLVFVLRGSPTGLVTASYDQLELNAAGYQLGYSVAGGGDVDGDGYSDVIAGAPFANPVFAQEGAVYWYRGNLARSLMRQSRQYLSDLVSPLSVNSEDYTNPQYFGIGHRARSPIQRTDARLRWEVVFEGQPFSGNPITNSLGSTGTGAVWTDLGVVAPEIKELIYKAAGYIRYKWRVRVEYQLAKLHDGQRFGRWFYGYANGWGDIGVLPVELLSFTGRPAGDVNELEWTTASEENSSAFIVQRSIDGGTFLDLGSVQAAGNSQQVIRYAFVDGEPLSGVAYYRLRIVDLDGAAEESSIVVLQRGANDVLLYPNPAETFVNVVPSLPGIATLQCSDATGRRVLTIDISNGAGAPVPLHVADLPPGFYAVDCLCASGAVLARSSFVKN